MKALAHWAIHHQQKLRLQGRTEAEIWGILTGPNGEQRRFRYRRGTRQLAIGDQDVPQVLQLDEYGFEQP